jgi:hypothetical protein
VPLPSRHFSPYHPDRVPPQLPFLTISPWSCPSQATISHHITLIVPLPSHHFSPYHPDHAVPIIPVPSSPCLCFGSYKCPDSRHSVVTIWLTVMILRTSCLHNDILSLSISLLSIHLTPPCIKL